MPLKVMITGVAGLIGNVLWKDLRRKPDKYDVYGLARRLQPSARLASGEMDETRQWQLVDVADFDAMRRAIEGMDVVVHMAADPRGDAPWEAVLKSNLIGAYNTYEACRLGGVKRIIYASSVMVSWGYWQDEPYKSLAEGKFKNLPAPLPIVTKEMPVRPTDLYSSSKLWGEALGRYYSDLHGLSVICLRIGGVNDPDRPRPSQIGHAVWCSRRDIAQMVERAINAPKELRYDIFYVISNNKYRFWDIEHGKKVLGYVPQAGVAEYRPAA